MKAGYASLRPESQATPALSKKEMPQKGVSPLRRRPTLRALDRRRLLKKAGENFHRDTAVKSPINQNMKLFRYLKESYVQRKYVVDKHAA